MLTSYYMILISVFTENQHPKWFCLVSFKAAIRFSLVGNISMWVLSQYWLSMTHSFVFTRLKHFSLFCTDLTVRKETLFKTELRWLQGFMEKHQHWDRMAKHLTICSSPQHHVKYQHLQQKTFTCSHPPCSKSFNFKKHLKEHEKLHSSEYSVHMNDLCDRCNYRCNPV